MQQVDTIVGKGFTYQACIGFHDCEKDVRQTLIIDFEVVFDSILKADDRIHLIKFDYYVAHQRMNELFAKSQFNLIETVAERIAEMFLRDFPILGATVSVTKRPLDMPNAGTVTYTCRRGT